MHVQLESTSQGHELLERRRLVEGKEAAEQGQVEPKDAEPTYVNWDNSNAHTEMFDHC